VHNPTANFPTTIFEQIAKKKSYNEVKICQPIFQLSKNEALYRKMKCGRTFLSNKALHFQILTLHRKVFWCFCLIFNFETISAGGNKPNSFVNKKLGVFSSNFKASLVVFILIFDQSLTPAVKSMGQGNP
jgi:hypothetical protein